MRYGVLFEVESDMPPHEVAATVRAAVESRGIVLQGGIDVVEPERVVLRKPRKDRRKAKATMKD